MQNVHWYSCCWLGIFIVIILYRRSSRARWWIPKKSFDDSQRCCTSWLRDKRTDLFPQDSALNLLLALIIVISNALTIFLFPGPSFLRSVSDRIGTLLLVNIDILLLVSLRHSIFFELAATYQPEFVWTHRVFGIVTAIQMTIFFGLEFREFTRQWPLLLGTISMMILVTCCLPVIPSGWEQLHQGVWRTIHWLLTVLVLIAFSLLLRSLPADVKPYYACAISLVVLEGVQAGCRRTVRDASFIVLDTGGYKIEAAGSEKVCNHGVFYYFRGKPFPAFQSTVSKPYGTSKNSEGKVMNTIVLEGEESEQVKTGQKSVVVQGPYGPGIGPLWWMYYWLHRVLRAPLLVDKHRPPHFLGISNIRIYVDSTAFARALSLWLWLTRNEPQSAPEIQGFGLAESLRKAYTGLLATETTDISFEPSNRSSVHFVNAMPETLTVYSADTNLAINYMEGILAMPATPPPKEIVDTIQKLLKCPLENPHSRVIIIGGQAKFLETIRAMHVGYRYYTI